MYVKISVHVWQKTALSLWSSDYVRVCVCMSAVSHNLESISAHHNTDDVSTQHRQMVSDSREYTYNDVEKDEKLYVQTL